MISLVNFWLVEILLGRGNMWALAALLAFITLNIQVCEHQTPT